MTLELVDAFSLNLVLAFVAGTVFRARNYGALGAIMMSATGLLMSRDPGQPQQAAVSRILTCGTRIKGMVNDLLDFTRTRLGAGIPLACAEIDLAEVGRQVVEEVAAYHPGRDLRFEASGPVRGSCDGARVGQALSNLVGNAVQHGSPETPVAVVARGTADEVAVAVHNRGPVIPPRPPAPDLQPAQADRPGGWPAGARLGEFGPRPIQCERDREGARRPDRRRVVGGRRHDLYRSPAATPTGILTDRAAGPPHHL